MGNAPSSLTKNNLLALKIFSVFNVFPEDSSVAGSLITNEATNTLKYVNSNFVSSIGGHRARKRNIVKTRISTKCVTPNRRYHREVVNPSSAPPPLSSKILQIQQYCQFVIATQPILIFHYVVRPSLILRYPFVIV